MKGWLKLLLDKVLRAVSSLVQTLTLGSISAAVEQECPQKSDGKRLAPRSTERKPVQRRGQRVLSRRKARLTNCSGLRVRAHLHSLHDFGATQVRDESWRGAKTGIKYRHESDWRFYHVFITSVVDFRQTNWKTHCSPFNSTCFYFQLRSLEEAFSSVLPISPPSISSVPALWTLGNTLRQSLQKRARGERL